MWNEEELHLSFLVPPILPSWKVEGGGEKGYQYRHRVPCFITASTVVLGQCLDSLWFISFHFCWNGGLHCGNSVLFSVLKIPVGRGGCVSLHFASSTSTLTSSYFQPSLLLLPWYFLWSSRTFKVFFFPKTLESWIPINLYLLLKSFSQCIPTSLLTASGNLWCYGDLLLFTYMSECLRTHIKLSQEFP